MSIMDYFRKKNTTASVAKERLKIVVAHERTQRNGPDYLPALHKEILAVVAKYVEIDASNVCVQLDHNEEELQVLELNITLPD